MPARPRTLPTGFIAPCLPTKANTLPSGGLWLHAIKHDGFRIIARKQIIRIVDQDLIDKAALVLAEGDDLGSLVSHRQRLRSHPSSAHGFGSSSFFLPARSNAALNAIMRMISSPRIVCICPSRVW